MSEGWHDVAALDELRARRPRRRPHRRPRDRRRSPTQAGGDLHAVRNRCPHHGAPLCLGTSADAAEGTPGGYALSDRRVLRCPWHGWEFDLENGRCLDDDAMRAAVYPVRVDDGRVLVQA